MLESIEKLRKWTELNHTVQYGNEFETLNGRLAPYELAELDAIADELEREFAGISGEPLTFPDYIDTSEEIVRCKDCKHYIAPGTVHFDDGTTNLGACSIVRAYMVKITPDDFCAWGEKKGNADD